MFHVKHSISGTDEEAEGDWRWVTSEPWGYTNWVNKEPDNLSSYERVEQNHLALFIRNSSFNNGWGDIQCIGDSYPAYTLANSGFICEWDYIDGSEPPPEKDWYTLNELMSDIDEDDLHDFWEKKVNTCELTDGLGRPLWRTPDQKLSWDDINNQDSDGDGLWDGEEIVVSYIENGDSYKVWAHMYSNPCLVDSDGDGIDDFIDPKPMVSDLTLWTANDDWSNEIRAKALALLPSGYAHWGINSAQITQYERDMFFLGIMYGIDYIEYDGKASKKANMPSVGTYDDNIMFLQGKIYAAMRLSEDSGRGLAEHALTEATNFSIALGDVYEYIQSHGTIGIGSLTTALSEKAATLEIAAVAKIAAGAIAIAAIDSFIKDRFVNSRASDALSADLAKHGAIMLATELASGAIAARDALVDQIRELSNTQIRKRVTVAAGYNKRTGDVSAQFKMEEQIRTHCVEDLIVADLMSRGATLDDIIMTPAIRPFNLKVIPVCKICQLKYSKSNFIPGTPFL